MVAARATDRARNGTKDLQIAFRLVTVASSGTATPRPLQGKTVNLVGKRIYLDDSRRSIKLSEIVNVEIVLQDAKTKEEEQEPETIVIYTSKSDNGVVRCQNPKSTRDLKKWIKKLLSLQGKKEEDNNNSNSNHQQPRRGNSTGATMGHPHPTGKSPLRKRRQAFEYAQIGTSSPKPSSSFSSRRRDRHDRASATASRASSLSPSRGTGRRKTFASGHVMTNSNKPLMPSPPIWDDDDDDKNNYDGSGSHSNANRQEDRFPWTEPIGRVQQQKDKDVQDDAMELDANDSDCNPPLLDEDHDHVMGEDEDDIVCSGPSRRARRDPSSKTKTRRIRAVEDDSDEDVVSMTTPSMSTQRVVSPSRTASTGPSAQKLFPSSSKTQSAMIMATAVTDEAPLERDANQPKISSFFGVDRNNIPSPPRRSFDPARNYAERQCPKTPSTTAKSERATPEQHRATKRPQTAPPKTSNTTCSSPVGRKLVPSSGGDTSRFFRHKNNGSWLGETSARSPSRKRLQSEHLFGLSARSTWQSGGRNEHLNVEDEDPIQEHSDGDNSVQTPPTATTTNPMAPNPVDILSSHRTVLPMLSSHKRTRLSHDSRKVVLGSGITVPPSLCPRSMVLGETTRPPLSLLDNDSLATRHPPPRHRGLRNLGNTCYLNASVQMLAGWCHERLISYYNEKKMDNNEEFSDSMPLTKNLVQVIQDLLADIPKQRSSSDLINSRLILNPSSLKRAMDLKTDKFAGYEQRDAHEFFSDLIDCIQGELEEGEPPPQETSPSLALPTDDFRLTVQVRLQCTSCGYERTKEELYRHLSIDLPRDDSTTPVEAAQISNSLQAFFKPELREIRCENCTTGTHAQQTMQIVSR